MRWFHPRDWSVILGCNINDKVASLTDLSSSWLWFLGFNQLLENSPIVVVGAWIASVAFLWRLLRYGARTVEEEPMETLAAIWFLSAALFVASFVYLPKRYHMLMFTPACLVTTALALRFVERRVSRGELLAGLSGTALILCFAFAMTGIRRRGEFVPQLGLDPANATQLLWSGSAAFAGCLAVLAILASRSRNWRESTPRSRSIMVGTLLALQVAIDGAAFWTWARGAQPSLVETARSVGQAMRSSRVRHRGGLVLGGQCAHAVMVEAHVQARRIVIERKANVYVIPEEPLSHLLIDDPRDLPIYRAHVPQLARRLKQVGSWSLCADWAVPQRWTLYELGPETRPAGR